MNEYNSCLMNTYSPLDVSFNYGEGACLYDTNNKKYIDFTSGIGVNSLGYNNEKWKEAILGQLNKFFYQTI